MDSPNVPPAKHGNPLLQRLINSDSPKTRFFQLLTSPWNPPAGLTFGVTSQASEDAMTMEPQTFTIRPDPETNPMMLPLHNPTGAWKWATGLGIRACTNVVHLDSDKKNSMYYGTGTIGAQNIQFICRTWPLRDDFPEFTSELGLFKAQLKPLLGTYVPNIIGVYTGIGIANVLMELPHPAFWIEASADMPDVLKKRCIEAYRKLHEAGVLHGSVHPRNILIGGDARVTIVNFGQAKVLDPIFKVNQRQTSAAELRLEMRKVKFQLNYDDARGKEKQKWADHKRSNAWNRRETHLAIRLQGETDQKKLETPMDSRKTKGWVDWKYESKRFIVPTISSEAFAQAADKFIANIRRMEREGDSPPSSRSPSPPLSSAQPVQDTGLQPAVTRVPDVDKHLNTCRSPRKRKVGPEIDLGVDSPLAKRQKTAMETVAPPTKPITMEGTIRRSPLVTLRDTSNLHAALDHDAGFSTPFPILVRDFAYEPTSGPSSLRSALKPPPPRSLESLSGDESQDRMSEKALRKRKYDEAEDGAISSGDGSPSKKIRADGLDLLPSQGDGKRVSFAPAPDVFLKKYTIPAHLFSKPKKGSRFRRRRSRLLSRSYSEDEGSDSETEYRDKSTNTFSRFRYDFTFTPRPFQSVSRWIADFFPTLHW